MSAWTYDDAVSPTEADVRRLYDAVGWSAYTTDMPSLMMADPTSYPIAHHA